MAKTFGRVLALLAIMLLAACEPRLLGPGYYRYGPPAPPPLQPYMGPSQSFAPFAPAPVRHKRVVRHHHRRHYRHHYRHHYRKRHPRVRCRCEPVSPTR